jgi:hypothetical protein
LEVRRQRRLDYALDWTLGVPTSILDAIVDASGTYTVTISSGDTAHGPVINVAGATVANNTGGSLTLRSGTGTLTISQGTFLLDGEFERGRHQRG